MSDPEKRTFPTDSGGAKEKKKDFVILYNENL
jgi:hypothetical protein